MTRSELEAAAVALPAVTKVVQWGESDVYKVGGKVFAICGLAGALSLKVSPVGFVALTEGGGPGRQAPYCAKGHWVAIELDACAEADILDWLRNAHALIAAKLTRAARRELGLA
jgi:predicted DNA-binding protein (MmcQ/YjbR family)